MLGWMQGGYNVSPLVEALELDQDWGIFLMAVMEHDTAVQQASPGNCRDRLCWSQPYVPWHHKIGRSNCPRLLGVAPQVYASEMKRHTAQTHSVPRILMFDAFYDVEEKMKKGNPYAKKVPIGPSAAPSAEVCGWNAEICRVRSWNPGRMQSGSRIVQRCQTKSST